MKNENNDNNPHSNDLTPDQLFSRINQLEHEISKGKLIQESMSELLRLYTVKLFIVILFIVLHYRLLQNTIMRMTCLKSFKMY